VIVNDPRAGAWKVASAECAKPLTRVAVARSIGRARGRNGKITFIPSRGTPRKRTIQAEITQNGLPRALLTIARFRASG
jgi:hypothetical protein